MHDFVHRNIKLSVYPQLFLISVGAENVTNFKKSEIVGPISSEQCFEIQISYVNLKIWAEMVPEILQSNNLKIP